MKIVALFIFLIAIRASGQPAASHAAPDFSAGFTRLVALGLPPLDAKAKWSTLPEQLNRSNDDYRVRMMLQSLKGNGWVIPGPDGKMQALPAFGVETVPLVSDSADSAPRGGLVGRMMGAPSAKNAADAPELDPAKDVATLIAQLQKEKPDSDPFSGNFDVKSAGKLLLLATQLHQTGHSKLANDLALAVFARCPSREAAVDAAVSVLADHAYDTTTKEFFASGDWASYHKSLTALLAKFPRGWSSREAVAMFHPQLAKLAAGASPPAPSLPGIALDPRALAAIQKFNEKPKAAGSQTDDAALLKSRHIDIAEIPAAYRAQLLASLRAGGEFRSDFSSLWLLDPPAEADGMTAVSHLTALKTQALPALAALLDDPFLTYLPNPNASSENSYYISSNSSESERIQQIYFNLMRPASRGEIAAMLLKSTLPEGDSDSSEVDVETLRETALDFWKAHQNATRDELAVVFLRDGSPSQSQSAAEILANSNDPKAHQALETHILDSDPAIARFQTVQTYLNSRKSVAKPFFEAYAKLVRSQTAGGNADDDSNPYSYQIKNAGGPEKVLKQLESLVTGKSPRALARELAKGKPEDVRAGIASIQSMMEKSTPVQRLYAMLEGAVAAEDPGIRCQFISAATNIDWPESDDENESATTKSDRSIPEAEIKAWLKLVDDTRPLPKNSSRSYYPQSEESTIGDIAALALCASVNPATCRAFFGAAPILRKKTSEIFREQAALRLAGKPIPPLPDASRVTPDRLKAIVAEAGTKKPLEIHPYLITLTPDERAAWLAWTVEPGELTCPDSVKQLRSIITESVPLLGAAPSNTNSTGKLTVGFQLSAESLTRYVETLAPEMEQHSRTHIQMWPAAFGPGLQIRHVVVPLPTQKPKDDSNEDESGDDEGPMIPSNSNYIFRQAIQTLDDNVSASSMISVSLNNRGQRNSQATWLVENSKATLQTADRNVAVAGTPLAEALTNLLDAANPQMFQIQIQVLTRADAAKFKAAAENPSTLTEEE